jgi:hypothetical protein
MSFELLIFEELYMILIRLYVAPSMPSSWLMHDLPYLCGEGFDDSFTVSDNVFGTDDDGDEVVVVVLAFGSVEVDPPFRSRRCFV